MENVKMGFKKKFVLVDFWNYFIMMLILLFILGGVFQVVIFFIVVVATSVIDISTKQDVVMLDQLFHVLIMLIGVIIVSICPLLILFVFRKFFYYEIAKHNMQNGYNFVINPNGIELLVQKEESVIIDINGIASINLSTYSAPFKSLIPSRSINYLRNDFQSNLAKTVIIIEVILKNDVDLTKFKRKGLYYKLFNFRKNKKTNQTKFYLYEIMYDAIYEKDMVVFHQYFGNLIQTDLEY